MTSQLSSQPAKQSAVYQWTGSPGVTQGQTQYGYNYHHIDQRTENLSGHQACIDTKPDRLENVTDVYAEFTTDAAEAQYGSGVSAAYCFDDPASNQDNSMCTSELQYCQYQSEDQNQYESEHAHYQFEEQSFYQSDARTEREDHASYVPEEYVHFLHER